MKILVVYASAGAGHRKAAEAIYNYIRLEQKQISVDIADILDYTPFLYKFFYEEGYFFLVSYLPTLWNILYRITDSRLLKPLINRISSILGYFSIFSFLKYLDQEDPDTIISTHFLLNELLVYLKRKNKINCKVVSVVTDFDVHSFWASRAVDKYIVATDYTKNALMKKQIPEDKIKVLGIPCDMKFSIRQDRKNMRQNLGLELDTFTALIVTGVIGIGPIEEIVKLLSKNGIQSIVVCGRNRSLFSRLKNKNYNKAKMLGFVDNVDELMSASDLIITKAGGLTIAESLAKELPMIFISIIPGQEEFNAHLLTNYGVGLIPSNLDDLIKIVVRLKEDSRELNKIKEKIKIINRPEALENIFYEVCANTSRSASRRAV